MAEYDTRSIDGIKRSFKSWMMEYAPSKEALREIRKQNVSRKNVDDRVVRLRLADGTTYSTSMKYLSKQTLALLAIGIKVKSAMIIGKTKGENNA